MTVTRTVGLYSLHCACGRPVRALDVLARTETGRETLRYFCYQCGCISWWWRTGGPEGKVMLMDREEKPRDCQKWPPLGWTKRHLSSRRR